MITQIEIDGFKTFKDFKVELAPFQVIVGANGSGKSNLFDALQLLGRLASHELSEAFQDLRGKPRELFIMLPDGSIMPKMRLAVELLLDRQVRDDAGRRVELPYTRLRYSVEIVYEEDPRGPASIHVLSEELKTIPRKDDTWIRKHNVSAGYLPDLVSNEDHIFIGTNTYMNPPDDQSQIFVGEPIVTVYRESRFAGDPLQYRAHDLPRTVLSLMVGTEYLPISVVRQEMRNWKFLHLYPEELRKPSFAQGPRFLSYHGGNLPTMIAHLQREDEFILTDISRDMASLIADIYRVKVELNPARNEYDIWVETSDHRVFSSTVLSDGTLHLLALTTVENDPQFQGLLCLEEPENSMHPLHIEQIARLLRRLATIFLANQSNKEPLKQILVTTHSPVFIGFPEIVDSLLLAFMPLQTGKSELMPSLVTRMVPVVSPQEVKLLKARGNKIVDIYILDTVREFLNVDRLKKVDKFFKEARLSLLEDGK